MKYKYSVISVNKKERWIYLKSNDEWNLEEPDSFFYLMEKISTGTGGKIESIGNTRYLIKGDGPNLIYQWDACFGITVVYPQKITDEEAISFLNAYLLS